tara:strand:+ start:337 stop:666 length:330 start_codon:yes stop_codon:yes gene_type:complete
MGDSEISTNATKKLKKANLDVMDSLLARHCEDKVVKFSKACVMFDLHEKRCGSGLGEAYRLGERRQQIAILKHLGFEFNSSIAEIDQTSVGRIWLQCRLNQYSPLVPAL